MVTHRAAANESAAVASLRLLNTAEVTYSSDMNGLYGTIPDLVAAGLLDARFGTAMQGFVFDAALSSDKFDYTATARARTLNEARFDFYTRPDYVIRYSTDPAHAPTGLTGEPVR